jgi:hypothetical protein
MRKRIIGVYSNDNNPFPSNDDASSNRRDSERRRGSFTGWEVGKRKMEYDEMLERRRMRGVIVGMIWVSWKARIRVLEFRFSSNASVSLYIYCDFKFDKIILNRRLMVRDGLTTPQTQNSYGAY